MCKNISDRGLLVVYQRDGPKTYSNLSSTHRVIGQAVNSRDLRINNSQAPKSQQLEIDATRAISSCGHLGLLRIG